MQAAMFVKCGKLEDGWSQGGKSGIKYSVVAIGAVAMVGGTAELVVPDVRIHDQCHGGRQEKELLLVPYLFGQQEEESQQEQEGGTGAVVVPEIAVVKTMGSHGESQEYHKVFKTMVFDDINTENGQAGEQQGQHGAVDGAGNRGGNAQNVVINLNWHKEGKISPMQLCCKIILLSHLNLQHE